MIPADRILHQLLEADRLLGVEAAPRARFPRPAPAPMRVAPPRAQAPAPVSAPRPTLPARAALPATPPPPAAASTGAPPSWQATLEIPLGSAAPAAPAPTLLFVSVEWGSPLSGETRALFDRQVAAMKVAPSSAGLVRLAWPAATEPDAQALAEAKAQVLAAVSRHRPRVAVLLGGFGAKAMVGAASLTLARGRWFTLEADGASCPACATWHPAQLGVDRDRRMQTWEDLQKVMAKLAE